MVDWPTTHDVLLHYETCLEEKHFEYFKEFNHSSFFEKFITDILFSQRFNQDIAYPKIKNIISKNFNFENLFQNFKIHNPEIEEISNFENYLLSLHNKTQNNDLLSFYRSVKLENKLNTKNTTKRNHKTLPIYQRHPENWSKN